MTNLLPANQSLVSVRSWLDPSQARLMKSVLESYGITAYIHGEHMAGMGMGLRSDLMVHTDDAAEAEKVLGKVAVLPNTVKPVYDADGDMIDCAQCGSERVTPHVGLVPTLIPGIKIQADSTGHWYHCRECGSYFSTRRSRFASWQVALAWSASLGVAVLCLYWFIEWLRWQ